MRISLDEHSPQQLIKMMQSAEYTNAIDVRAHESPLQRSPTFIYFFKNGTP
jgi:hypothetical protein